ncbi:unnamed protein product [Paramecium pentaurelia]|uniref:Tetratricopeptide repeat protein n=1 Tax=Paramecium pentaurelia TaxID=43138 RepID=A0A8S1VJS7_9CILI|nr:unnamed protein product [Paramecium pentaurelia]
MRLQKSKQSSIIMVQRLNNKQSIGQCLFTLLIFTDKRLLNKYEDAITWFDKALACDQKHVNSLFGKGECLRILRKYDESLKILDQALSINPQHNFSLKSKGACLF